MDSQGRQVIVCDNGTGVILIIYALTLKKLAAIFTKLFYLLY